MKDNKVVKYEHLPARGPFMGLSVIWLLLDRFRAPGWMYGVAGTLAVILVIGWVYKLYIQRQSEPSWKP